MAILRHWILCEWIPMLHPLSSAIPLVLQEATSLLALHLREGVGQEEEEEVVMEEGWGGRTPHSKGTDRVGCGC